MYDLARLEARPSQAAQLVAAARGGDEEAWRSLVARHDNIVRHGVRRIRGLSPDDYEDAAATTWLRFVDDIHRLRNPDAISSWLRTTAYREALRIAHARHRSRLIEIELVPDAVGVEPDVDSGLMRRHLAMAIGGVMDELSPTGRRLLAAFLDDPDASYKQIEARHGIAVSSIGPIRRRVLDKLERALREVGVSDAPAASSSS